MKTKILMAVALLLLTLGVGSTSFSATYQGKVNLNTATVTQLTALPGIGQSKAAAILEYRQKKQFTKSEELMLIRGIGEKLYAKIKDLVSLQGKSNLVKTP